MGNTISYKYTQTRQDHPRGKVILRDGSVHEFEPPLTAAELMMDHPQQAVVEFRSAVTGKRPAALPADASLDAEKIYLMIPMRRGSGKASALTGDEIRRVILAANSAIRSRASLGSKPSSNSTMSFLPVFARVCVVEPSDSNINKKKNKKEEEKEKTSETTSSLVCEEEEKKTASFVGLLESFGEGTGGVYLSRQVSGKRGNWKPTLETIEEKVLKNNSHHHNNKKIAHWLF